MRENIKNTGEEEIHSIGIDFYRKFGLWRSFSRQSVFLIGQMTALANHKHCLPGNYVTNGDM